ncbi:MAG: hypothetical protein RBG13Loki_1741 [Promethearchaeota archaeon CR_4]|nr:MAG: hypothetical protein RBG13Loki_1741 [Candidatus Lokiarchaeota archaeon CR_4]
MGAEKKIFVEGLLIESEIDVLEFFAPIDLLIAKREFAEAQTHLIKLIWDHPENPDIRYTAIEKVRSIVDKSTETLEWIVPELLRIAELPDEFLQYHALKALETISDFRPNFLLRFVDPSVQFTLSDDEDERQIAMNILGNILKLSLAPRDDICAILFRALDDSSWKVKIRALSKLKEILQAGGLLESRLIEILPKIVNMLGEGEEVHNEVLGLLVLAGHILPNQVILPILLRERPGDSIDIQNGILYVIGEIARQNPTRLNIIIPQIVKFFAHPDELIQTQATQAAVKVALGDPTHTIPVLLEKIVEIGSECQKGLEEVLIVLGAENPEIILPYLLIALEDPNATIRTSIFNVLRELYHEVPHKIEGRLYDLILNFEEDNWRNRLQALTIVSTLAGVFTKPDYISFIALKFKELFADEDVDVSEEAQNAFRRLKKTHPNIEELIANFQKKQHELEIEIQELRTLPKILRLQINKLIDAGALDQARIVLEQDFKRFNDRLHQFDLQFQQSHQKALLVMLFEDWLDLRDQIMSEMSDVKAYLNDIITGRRMERQDELQKILRHLDKRKTILESQFEYLRIQLANLPKTSAGDSQQVTVNIDAFINLRSKIFEFETDLNKAYVIYLDFKPLFNHFSKSWQDLKKNILKLLEQQNETVKQYYRQTRDSPACGANFRENYTFEVLMQQLLELVSESIRIYLDSVENIFADFQPIYNLIECGDFGKARELLKFHVLERFRDIDQRNVQIIKLTEDLEMLFPEFDRSKNIRVYVENWQLIRDEVLKRIKSFEQETLEKILAKEISGMLQMVNPLKFSQIAQYVQLSEPELRDILMRILDKKLIFARMEGGFLRGHDRSNRPEKIFSIQKEYEMLGNRLKFILRVTNRSNFVIRDVSILLKLPCILEAENPKTSQNYLNLGEYEPNATKKVEWELRISTDPMKRRMKLGKVTLMLNFTDFQNHPQTKFKEFDLIIY